MTGVHRDTIMRLTVRAGETCARVLDARMRDLSCQRLQVDEIWGYIGKKQHHVTSNDDLFTTGDVWTFVTLDADSKLLPTFRVGKRNGPMARAFVSDLADRMTNRVQLSSDALELYVEAVERAWGTDVDYGQIVKSYEAEPVGPGRYSPPKVFSAARATIQGKPDPAHISTSYIERQNLTMRMQCRRLTRLTNAFSKKIANFRAAMGLHFAHYNFVRIHSTVKVTPAMAAGVVGELWSRMKQAFSLGRQPATL